MDKFELEYQRRKMASQKKETYETMLEQARKAINESNALWQNPSGDKVQMDAQTGKMKPGGKSNITINNMIHRAAFDLDDAHNKMEEDHPAHEHLNSATGKLDRANVMLQETAIDILNCAETIGTECHYALEADYQETKEDALLKIQKMVLALNNIAHKLNPQMLNEVNKQGKDLDRNAEADASLYDSED